MGSSAPTCIIPSTPGEVCPCPLRHPLRCHLLHQITKVMLQEELALCVSASCARCVARPQTPPASCSVMTVTLATTVLPGPPTAHPCPRVAGSVRKWSGLPSGGPDMLKVSMMLNTWLRLGLEGQAGLGALGRSGVEGSVFLPPPGVSCMQCGAASPGFHCEWQNSYTLRALCQPGDLPYLSCPLRGGGPADQCARDGQVPVSPR